MKLRNFLSIMGVVALVAVIYSPSTIGLSGSPAGDGGTAPSDTSASGTSMFLAYLQQQGYKVTTATSSQQVLRTVQGDTRVVYILVGADHQLNDTEVSAISSAFGSGRVSVLIAEGNTTNTALLASFGLSASGYPVVDPSSTFQNREVFPVDLNLGPGATASGVIDIASPISLTDSFLHPVAQSSASSYDLGNATLAPRTVVAAGNDPAGGRAVVIGDSGPFTNYLLNYTQGGVNEKAFVSAMVRYVDPDKSVPILLDVSQYAVAKPLAPSLKEGFPIGPFVAYSLEQSLSGLNGLYSGFPSEVSGFLSGFGLDVSPGFASAIVAAIVLFSVYGAVTRWFAPEKRGRDDQKQVSVEKAVVAESRERTDFLATARSKGGYVATLAQLYELIDSIVLEEFGKGISTVKGRDLAAKLGTERAIEAKKLFVTLTKFHDYAAGKTRFLFPPVVRWRALTAKTTREAQAFLDTIGVTMTGEDAAKRRMAVEARA